MYELEAYSISNNNQNKIKNFIFNNNSISNLNENLIFENNLEFENVFLEKKNESLIFKNSYFKNVFFKNIDRNSIDNIIFDNCKLENVRFYKCETSLIIQDSKIEGQIELNNCNGSIDLSQVDSKEIVIEKFSKLEQLLIGEDSYINNIEVRDASIKSLLLDQSNIGIISIKNKLPEIELTNNSNIELLNITHEKELDKLLNYKLSSNFNSKESTQGLNKIKYLTWLDYRIRLILAAYNYYQAHNDFRLMDRCLITIREVDNKIKILSSENKIKKLSFKFQNLIIGKLFGWGVKITNSLFTTLFIILFFTLVYFSYYLKNNSFFNSLLFSFQESLERFFNLSSHNVQIFTYFDSIEDIIGFIILTIITGIMVRKIIR